MAGSLRFGEFDLDLDAYVLRHRGASVKLEKQPMEVLILLVQRAGALVDRFEIQTRLWSADVTVEYGPAINTVIRKIRQALGDDADAPRYVETVVGKGYRFIASVERTPVGPVRPAPNAPSALPGAHEVCVRARHALEKRGEPRLRDAIRLFQDAIDIDPTCAPAYAGLADSYGQLGYGSYVAPEDSFARAAAAARRALELDPGFADAHAALGFALMYYDWDFAAAERAFTRALQLNPKSAVAHQWYAYLLTAMGCSAADAEREITNARRLDPLSAAIHIDHAYILHYYNRNEEALRAVRLALEMNPNNPLAYFWLGRIYTAEHRYADAETALEHIGPLRTWAPAMAVLGYLYGKTGRIEEANGVLEAFEDLRRSGRYASGYAIAVVHAGLGDGARAMSSLEAAYAERSHWLVWLKRDPRWNEIRSERRFEQLAAAIGLSS
jgi:DNA-binding winged helix-turn-helix (wHTH) protein/Flp pilus assembly protein TadD